MPGVERIWLPGEQSHLKKQDNLRHGVALSPALIEQLALLAQELQITPLATA
jgi:LDH2 family malate/lactate/ureidoglycolate dehydrogenase